MSIVNVSPHGGSEYTSGSAMESYNLEGPYFRVVLGFIGITDITIVHGGERTKLRRGRLQRLSSLRSLLTRLISQLPSKSGFRKKRRAGNSTVRRSVF